MLLTQRNLTPVCCCSPARDGNAYWDHMLCQWSTDAQLMGKQQHLACTTIILWDNEISYLLARQSRALDNLHEKKKCYAAETVAANYYSLRCSITNLGQNASAETNQTSNQHRANVAPVSPRSQFFVLWKCLCRFSTAPITTTSLHQLPLSSSPSASTASKLERVDVETFSDLVFRNLYSLYNSIEH